MNASLKKYIINVLVAFDQLVNAITGGDPDMTISGRAGWAIKEGRCALCKPLCWFLGLFDKDHCAKNANWEFDEGKDEVIKL